MVDNYSTNIQTGTADLGVTSSIDVDLTKTGDYNILNEEGTEFAFNGNKSIMQKHLMVNLNQ